MFRYVLLPIALAAALFGEPHRGTVRSAGLPIPGATVTATSGANSVSAVTDEAGAYVLDLPPGNWNIEIQMFGFTPLKSSVTSPADQQKDWTLELRPRTMAARPPIGPGQRGFQAVNLDQAANTAELTAMMANQEAAPASATPDTGDAFLVAGSVTSDLQNSARDDFMLRARAEMMAAGGGPGGAPGGVPGFNNGDPNAQPSLASAGGPPGGPGGGPGGGFAGRGGGPGFPGRGGFGGGPGPGGFGGRGGPGALAERMGRRPGSINAIGNRARRNRNPIRGMASFTARNSVLDARPFSLTGQELPKADYSQYRYSVMLGGPLLIPKVISGDRTFFTFNYNGNRSSNPYDATATVPLASERAGDFSDQSARQAFTLFDPLTRQPFANNVIPLSRISPISLGLLDYIPLPNQPGAVQNYRFISTNTQNTSNLGVRLNQTITRKDRVDVNFQRQTRDGQSIQIYQFVDEQSGSGFSVATGWSHTFSRKLINNVRFNLQRNRSETLPFFAYGEDVAAALGILGTSREPVNYGPPNLTFTNFGNLTDASPVLRRDQQASITESMIIVAGSHSLQTGFEFRRTQNNPRTDQNARGTYSFSGLLTSQFIDGRPVAGTGFDLADLLLGFPQSSSIRYGSSSNYFRQSGYSTWVQDDWKIRTNLSINGGVRYEYVTPFREKYNRLANLDVRQYFTGVAVVTPGDTGPYTGAFPVYLVEPDKNNFSPRIGIAWKPSSKRTMQIRAGYGMYFNSGVYSNFVSRLASQPPFAQTQSVTTSIGAPLVVDTAFTAVLPQSITNTYAVDRYYKLGYAQTWSFAVQTNLPHALILDVGYVGTKGTHLDIERQPNRAAPGSPLTAEQRRQIGDAVGFNYESAEGNSIYNSMNIRLARRFQRGMSWNMNYTFSRSIDNASTFGGGGTTVAQNDKDLRAERGLSSFDRRHVFNMNYMLASPIGQNALLRTQNRFLNLLFQDWNFSGGITAQTGVPLTARVLGNQSNIGGTGSVGSGRAQATGEPVTSGTGLFNTAAFTIPVAGTFGNAGRNTIPGPGQFFLNVGLGRSFRMHDDRRRLEFRLDSNNVTNNVSYTGYGTVVNALNYGLATSTAAMRSVNMTLRLRF